MQQCTVVMLNVDFTILSVFNCFPDFNVPKRKQCSEKLAAGFVGRVGLVVQRDRSCVKTAPKMPIQTAGIAVMPKEQGNIKI